MRGNRVSMTVKVPSNRQIAEAVRQLNSALDEANKRISAALESVRRNFPSSFAAALRTVRLEARVDVAELSTRAGRAQALVDGFTLRATHLDGEWSELRVRDGDFEERCSEAPDDWEHAPNPLGWESRDLTWSVAGDARPRPTAESYAIKLPVPVD